MVDERDAKAAPRLAAAGVLGYLLGSIPSADLAARAAGGAIDLRSVGSRNPGALNAAQALGRRWGLAVLAADVAKGAAAGVAGRIVGGDGGAYTGAAAAIAGHIAPPRNGFRGGKGIATSAGACLAVFPVYFPVDAAVAAAGALGSQRAATAVRWSCAAWVLAAVAAWRFRLPNGWGPAPGPGLVAFAASGSAMILAKFAASGSPPVRTGRAQVDAHSARPRRRRLA